MRYNAWATVLIGLSALCLTACSVSRQALRSEVSSQTSSVTRDTVREEVLVAVHDTLREITTITIQQNEAGDTVKQSIVTDRYRGRNAEAAKVHDERLTVQRDTVYIEKRDSVYVQNTGITNPTNKKNSFVSSLKWIFGIILGLIALTITAKVCLRKW